MYRYLNRFVADRHQICIHCLCGVKPENFRKKFPPLKFFVTLESLVDFSELAICLWVSGLPVATFAGRFIYTENVVFVGHVTAQFLGVY